MALHAHFLALPLKMLFCSVKTKRSREKKKVSALFFPRPNYCAYYNGNGENRHIAARDFEDLWIVESGLFLNKNEKRKDTLYESEINFGKLSILCVLFQRQFPSSLSPDISFSIASILFPFRPLNSISGEENNFNEPILAFSLQTPRTSERAFFRSFFSHWDTSLVCSVLGCSLSYSMIVARGREGRKLCPAYGSEIGPRINASPIA